MVIWPLSALRAVKSARKSYSAFAPDDGSHKVDADGRQGEVLDAPIV